MASDRVACHGIGGEYYGGIVDADDIKLAGIEYGSSEAAKGVCEGKLDKALQILRTVLPAGFSDAPFNNSSAKECGVDNPDMTDAQRRALVDLQRFYKADVSASEGLSPLERGAVATAAVVAADFLFAKGYLTKTAYNTVCDVYNIFRHPLVAAETAWGRVTHPVRTLQNAANGVVDGACDFGRHVKDSVVGKAVGGVYTYFCGERHQEGMEPLLVMI